VNQAPLRNLAAICSEKRVGVPASALACSSTDNYPLFFGTEPENNKALGDFTPISAVDGSSRKPQLMVYG
jgi:hypothetical protein